MDDLEHRTRAPKDPGRQAKADPPRPPKPKPQPRKVRLVLRVVSGTMQPLADATVTLHEFVGPSKRTIPLTSQDGAWVGEVTGGSGSLMLLVKRPSQPIPRVYGPIVHPDGRVESNQDLLLRVLENRPDGDRNVATLEVIFPRVSEVTDSLPLTGPFAGLINKWVFPEKSIPCVDLARMQSGQSPVLEFTVTDRVQPEVVIFDVEGLTVRRPVAVAYPKGLADFRNLLLFYHHTIQQNREEYEDKGAEYPYGMAFLLFGFFHYLGGKRAMAYQLAASRRQLALVLPLADFQGVGEFDRDPATIKNVLLEIIGHFNRTRRQDYTPPQLGRFAVGSYSSGIHHTLNLFEKGGPLLKEISEVYDIDGSRSSFGARTTRHSFAGGGRLVRRYEQGWPGWPAAHRLGGLNPAVFCLPWFRWLKEATFPHQGKTEKEIRQLIKKTPALEKQLGGYVHGVMPAYMLLHALSISQFPKV